MRVMLLKFCIVFILWYRGCQHQIYSVVQMFIYHDMYILNTSDEGKRQYSISNGRVMANSIAAGRHKLAKVTQSFALAFNFVLVPNNQWKFSFLKGI